MLKVIYHKLIKAYGPQGWWPIVTSTAADPAETGAVHGYHPGDYSFPRKVRETFEICLGAILTQNTAWTNVEKALLNLAAISDVTPRAILNLPENQLREAIRPSGYFNVKARKISGFTQFYLSLKGRIPERRELLDVWGIGPETADSIRLYAYGQLEMVVDAYTQRILGSLKAAELEKASYDELKQFCTASLPADLAVYQEFHALMVEHGKRYYMRQPYHDPLITRNTVLK